jgi:hypothetical protein
MQEKLKMLLRVVKRKWFYQLGDFSIQCLVTVKKKNSNVIYRIIILLCLGEIVNLLLL